MLAALHHFLLLTALLALGGTPALGAGRGLKEEFNGAVHGDPAPDDPAMQGEQLPQGGWVDVELVMPFTTKVHYTPAQYRVDDGYVTLRGWAVAKAKAKEGVVVFRLPPEASPGRDETYSVHLKGVEKRITAHTDGTVTLDIAMEWNSWLPLTGFSYQSAANYGPPGGARDELGDGGNEL